MLKQNYLHPKNSIMMDMNGELYDTVKLLKGESDAKVERVKNHLHPQNGVVMDNEGNLHDMVEIFKSLGGLAPEKEVLVYKEGWGNKYSEEGVIWQEVNGTVKCTASIKRSEGTNLVFAEIPEHLTPTRPLRFPAVTFNGDQWLNDGVIFIDQFNHTLVYQQGNTAINPDCIVTFSISWDIV